MRAVRRRHSIRLAGHDYRSPATYFITLIAYQRAEIFGEIVDGKMRLSQLGEIVREEWLRSATLRREVSLDAFQIMPNHLHGIVTFRPSPDHRVGAHGRKPLSAQHPRAPRSLGSFVAGFKSAATLRINEARNMPGTPVWQRNYHERIVRNARELHAARRYIIDNPRNWATDAENPGVASQHRR